VEWKIDNSNITEKIMQPFLSVFVVPVCGITGSGFFDLFNLIFLHEDEFNSRLMMYMILPSIFPTAL